MKHSTYLILIGILALIVSPNAMAGSTKTADSILKKTEAMFEKLGLTGESAHTKKKSPHPKADSSVTTSVRSYREGQTHQGETKRTKWGFAPNQESLTPAGERAQEPAMEVIESKYLPPRSRERALVSPPLRSEGVEPSAGRTASRQLLSAVKGKKSEKEARAQEFDEKELELLSSLTETVSELKREVEMPQTTSSLVITPRESDSEEQVLSPSPVESKPNGGSDLSAFRVKVQSKTRGFAQYMESQRQEKINAPPVNPTPKEHPLQGAYNLPAELRNMSEFRTQATLSNRRLF